MMNVSYQLAYCNSFTFSSHSKALLSNDSIGKCPTRVKCTRLCYPKLWYWVTMTATHNQEPRNISISYTTAPVPHLSLFLTQLQSFPHPFLLENATSYRPLNMNFISEQDGVINRIVWNKNEPPRLVMYPRAGPRERVVFAPKKVKAAIVTCGGLCPGLNTVIRELTECLSYQYGVVDIFGVLQGYRGFYSKEWIHLTTEKVDNIHKMGGTVLGSSRGGFDLNKIVDSIVQNGINQVYVIGGDGTIRGAAALSEECRRRKLQVTVASIPKTIDNDIPIIDKSFGFDTAVQEASKAIDAAHTEVSCFPNGIGIVKLMGRNSGFIALYASLSSREVDCCLIPEVPFVIHGRGGLIEYVHKCLLERGKMVLVVAEGAGQEYVRNDSWVDQLDASGNKKLGDIGHFLYQEIESTLKKQGMEVSMKYIDPTYMIRAVASNASDNIYCTLLAHSAVHGSFAGYTGFTVGPINGRHAYIPMTEIVTAQKQVDLRDRMWSRLVNSTGQPDFSPKDIPKGFQGPCLYSREGEESLQTMKTVDKGFPGETP
ncbi:hypothetical protein GpartN1_g1017.t1 [Galdieria partita]|uniref:ATP-dependent 6-phosphofructokinase n=1 Tax=Galdieria partita TaxID=83374 RepID=A0A9C7PSX3_9RHOD|nr:hypothetical protein GpartN1_g1017.t1 [Galdieria partita]